MKTPSNTNEFLVQLFEMLNRIAIDHGAALESAESLLPLSIEGNAKTPFDRGVLACVAHVCALARNVPECRKALLDLGFEPFFQDVEGPIGSGRNEHLVALIARRRKQRRASQPVAISPGLFRRRVDQLKRLK